MSEKIIDKITKENLKKIILNTLIRIIQKLLINENIHFSFLHKSQNLNLFEITLYLTNIIIKPV
jgi:hypothetical protein